MKSVPLFLSIDMSTGADFCLQYLDRIFKDLSKTSTEFVSACVQKLTDHLRWECSSLSPRVLATIKLSPIPPGLYYNLKISEPFYSVS